MNGNTSRALKRKKRMSEAIVKIVIANKVLNDQDTELVEIRETLNINRQNFNFYLNDDQFLLNELKRYGIQEYTGKKKRYFSIDEDKLQKILKKGR